MESSDEDRCKTPTLDNPRADKIQYSLECIHQGQLGYTEMLEALKLNRDNLGFIFMSLHDPTSPFVFITWDTQNQEVNIPRISLLDFQTELNNVIYSLNVCIC